MSNAFQDLSRRLSSTLDPHGSSNASSDPQTIRGPGPTNGRSHSVFGSSLPHRAPARSFVHQSSNFPPESAQYSSEGIREQTASISNRPFDSIASRRFSGSKRSEPSPIDELGEPSVAGARVRDSSLGRLNHGSSTSSGRSSISRGARGAPSNIASLFERTVGDSQPGVTPQNNVAAVTLQRSHTNNSSAIDDRMDERTPLLGHQSEPVGDQQTDSKRPQDLERQHPYRKGSNKFHQLAHLASKNTRNAFAIAIHPGRWSIQAVWESGIKKPVGLLPCVFLGVLLNVLDALSYGMILFPLGEPIFAKTGPDGISIFYVSCIVSQLVYSSGGSIFKGAVGSEMIEVVPFFHKMTYTVMEITGPDRPEVVLATVITSYAMSSVLTGIVFGLLGALKLGSLVNFFPRHILIGCIGGVGFFLFVTGIEVSARLEGTLEYNVQTLQKLFASDTVLLWIVPFALSILLLLIKRFNQSPFAVPAFFIAIAGIFYVVVAAAPGLHVALLREQGWIFNAVESGVPFYHFYTYYDFRIINWEALAATIPSMFALTFFGVLHVPINVPALAIASGEDDLNLNRELVAHGVSNALSGFCGSIQNYLVYVNSEMFISNGGNHRLAGFMLAAATFGVLVAGPAMIGFVPIMVVGALIFYLGIELLEEALVSTWGRMEKLEYLTVVVIVLTMGIYDFVGGILVGIVLACLSFVVETSRKSAVRATFSGENVESTVRRHIVQRHFLHSAGRQIVVTKLAGMLFFGSIVRVEKQTRALIEEEAFQLQPIRFLVFDFAHVTGVDYSAAEAFTRIQRILNRRDVRMIVSGVGKNTEVGKSLQSVGLWQEDSTVEYFENLNLALEACENQLLNTFYEERDAAAGNRAKERSAGILDIPKADGLNPPPVAPASIEHFSESPRRAILQQAATTTLDAHSNTAVPSSKWSALPPPLPLLLHCFEDLSTYNEDFWYRAVPFFKRVTYPAGTVLFHRGDSPDSFLLVESGMLRAKYVMPAGTYHESIVPFTTCGELPFFSDTPRTATVSAEIDVVAWSLDRESWTRLSKEWPEGAREFLRVALGSTRERVESVTGYVLTMAG